MRLTNMNVDIAELIRRLRLLFDNHPELELSEDEEWTKTVLFAVLETIDEQDKKGNV